MCLETIGLSGKMDLAVQAKPLMPKADGFLHSLCSLIESFLRPGVTEPQRRVSSKHRVYRSTQSISCGLGI